MQVLFSAILFFCLDLQSVSQEIVRHCFELIIICKRSKLIALSSLLIQMTIFSGTSSKILLIFKSSGSLYFMKLIYSKLVQFENISSIVTTLLVPKFDKSNSTKFLQPENIKSICSTPDVSKLETFNDVNELQL